MLARELGAAAALRLEADHADLLRVGIGQRQVGHELVCIILLFDIHELVGIILLFDIRLI